jgi:hypothetical protein
MALSGVHIEFGVGTSGINGMLSAPVLRGALASSQTMASAGTSTIAASGSGNGYQPIMTISTSAAIFFAVGQTPDATNGARRYMDIGSLDVIVSPGDKVAWILAS